MMSWLDSLPFWLYFTLRTLAILLGAGLFSIVLIRLTDPQHWMFEGWSWTEFRVMGLVRVLQFLLFVMLYILFIGVSFIAMMALLCSPALVFYYALGFSREDAFRLGPASIGLCCMLWMLWNGWSEQRKEEKAKRAAALSSTDSPE